MNHVNFVHQLCLCTQPSIVLVIKLPADSDGGELAHTSRRSTVEVHLSQVSMRSKQSQSPCATGYDVPTVGMHRKRRYHTIRVIRQ